MLKKILQRLLFTTLHLLVIAFITLVFLTQDGKTRDDKTLILNAYLGDLAAQRTLEEMYRNGNGINKNEDKALRWLEKIADQGYADAQFMLANIYFMDKGTVSDNKIAFSWFEKAALQGHAEAQYVLGFFFLQGQGVRKDKQQAARWYELSGFNGFEKAYGMKRKIFEELASQGDVTIQRELAQLYSRGVDGPGDLMRSVFWHKKASEQGQSESTETLRQLCKVSWKLCVDNQAFIDSKPSILNDAKNSCTRAIFSDGHWTKSNDTPTISWNDFTNGDSVILTGIITINEKEIFLYKANGDKYQADLTCSFDFNKNIVTAWDVVSRKL